MGFADLLIAKIAADYSEPVAKELSVCNQLGIAYKTKRRFGVGGCKGNYFLSFV
jgi:hypothetical protein